MCSEQPDLQVAISAPTNVAEVHTKLEPTLIPLKPAPYLSKTAHPYLSFILTPSTPSLALSAQDISRIYVSCQSPSSLP